MKKLFGLLSVALSLLTAQTTHSMFSGLGPTPSSGDIENAIKADLRRILDEAGAPSGTITVQEAQSRLDKLDKAITAEIAKYRKGGDEATATALTQVYTNLLPNLQRALDILSGGGDTIRLKALRHIVANYAPDRNPNAQQLAAVMEKDFNIASAIIQNLDFSQQLPSASPLDETYSEISRNYLKWAKEFQPNLSLSQLQDVKQHFTDEVAQSLAGLTEAEQKTFIQWVGGDAEYFGTKIDQALGKLTTPPTPPADLTQALVDLSTDLQALASSVA